MSDFDYMAPAELFVVQGPGGLKYRRFPRGAEAIRYAIEKVPAKLFPGTRLEVEEQSYDGKQIRALYDNEDYPFKRNAPSSPSSNFLK